MDNITDEEDGLQEQSRLLRSTDEDGLVSSHRTGSTYEEAISATGYGSFQYKLLALCGWALSSDAIEVLCISFVLPVAESDLDLTDTRRGWLNSGMFLGMMIGGYLWGTLADSKGRRAVLLWSLTINALGGLASSVAQTYWLFVLLRFISGIGVGGSLPVIFTYYCEFQPKEKRGSMISLLATFWMCGNIVAAASAINWCLWVVTALAWAIIPINFRVGTESFTYTSWRVYLSLCILPSFTSALVFVLMPESPKFLMQIKSLDVRLPENQATAGNEKHSAYLLRKMSDFLRRTKSLFRSDMRRVTILMIFIFFFLSFGYYGLFLWFPELFNRIEKYGGSPCNLGTGNGTGDASDNTVSNNVYWESFLTALSNLPGNILTLLLIDRVGRKPLLVSSMVLSGLSVFFIWFLKTKRDSIIMSCVFGGVSVIGFNTLDVLQVELFPTDLRSTSSGVLSGLSRIAAILGNLTFGALVGTNCAVPMILVASLLGTGGLLALKLPNYTGRDLT